VSRTPLPISPFDDQEVVSKDDGRDPWERRAGVGKQAREKVISGCGYGGGWECETELLTRRRASGIIWSFEVNQMLAADVSRHVHKKIVLEMCGTEAEELGLPLSTPDVTQGRLPHLGPLTAPVSLPPGLVHGV